MRLRNIGRNCYLPNLRYLSTPLSTPLSTTLPNTIVNTIKMDIFKCHHEHKTLFVLCQGILINLNNIAAVKLQDSVIYFHGNELIKTQFTYATKEEATEDFDRLTKYIVRMY